MVFIKKILLKGFKSYQEQLDFDDFDPHYNIVVGKNGSGKSNFYDAIRFVLCDEKFGNLRAGDRQFLLHEGSGESVVSAYVEVIFDNSDRRFMVEKDEVSVKRCIGLQKDEYFLNDKKVKKEEVMNLLESAGFSRSNPYYIVQQNRVNSLAMMKDSERLDLLREIAGTRVYDERREESFSMLKENANKIDQIEEVMNYIKERLTELKDEQQELDEYEKLDKQRKGIERALVVKKINSLNTELEKNENDRKKQQRKMEGDREGELREVKRAREALTEEVSILEQKRTIMSSQAEDAAKMKEEADELVRCGKELTALQNELNHQKQRAEDLKGKISGINAEEKDLNDTLLEKQRNMSKAQALVDEFYNKIGRKAKYSSDEEYKNAIQNEIDELQKFVTNKEEEMKKMKQEIVELKTTNMTQSQKEIQGVFVVKRKMDELRKRKDDLTVKKRLVDSKIVTFENTRQTMTKDLFNLYKRAESSRIKKQITIAEFLKNYADEKRMNESTTKYFGMVAENITCKDELYTAVEAIGGNGLFYCLVDTDETAMKLIEVLDEKKIGRMSFIPLNQVRDKDEMENSSRSENGEGSENETNKRLIIKELEFSDEIRKGVQFVFGNAILCNTAEEAMEYQKEHKNRCVTIDGDVLSGKGVVTGGYQGEGSLMVLRLIAETKVKMIELEKDFLGTENEKKLIEKQQNEVLTEMEKMSTAMAEEEVLYERQRMERMIEMKKADRVREAIRQKEKSVEDADKMISMNSQKILLLEQEMKEKSTVDRNTIEEAKTDLKEKTNEVLELEKKRTEIENRRQVLRNEYQFQVLQKISEIEKRMNGIKGGGDTGDVEKYKQMVKKSISDLEEITKEIETKVKEQRELEIKERALEVAKSKEEKEDMDREKKLTRLFEKRTVLESKKGECEKRLEDIGKIYDIIDENELDLDDQLEETMKKLKGYRHVNKKARDQYKGFIEQQEGLMDRKNEIVDTQQTIYDLIESLDEKKEEAIERTFKGVSKGFSEIFTKLVPLGKASLVMLKKPIEELDEKERLALGAFTQSQTMTATNNTNTESTQIPIKKRKEKTEVYSGISLRVIFPAFGGDAKTIQQLSGGQKTVVALSLIFAIQRCDPAPFYLFDEIDSNLDNVYRTAVAQLITEQSKEAQYVVTTFRPELIGPAKKWYEIKHQNKVSSISVVTKEDALDVIKEDEINRSAVSTPFQTPLQTPKQPESSEQLTPNV
ncbi:structural maintenance of chromosome protein, putative [Entamoeba invadens IP1]|uniref:Structural maintenance of chromosomes protein n=1 Tax=Entamoeba invadens IP1 TaxID=370355 RepID=A0A0A1U8K6_ENTIV|nr:structural maintenance of chromosome protein, putative [Entamoeba invadens IP1]ELP89408.1 structural maintenance of chromosome protein, putative [Entamoeba invadens IP1]|eukprot:XP_004256179.1 structural maintenance of chromosome protein, putative [Entamoeba invadens IP1]